MLTPKQVPPQDGILWVQIAIRFFNAFRLRWVALAAGFLFGLQLALMLGAGKTGALALLVKPLLTVGFLAAAWHQEKRQAPEVKHLLAGFQSNIQVLLGLGVLYAFAAEAAVWLAQQLTGFEPISLTGKTTPTPDDLIKMLTHFAWTFAFMLPVIAAVWFAPALVVFDDAGLLTAIKLSLKASLQNLPAIIFSTLTLFALTAFLMSVVFLLARIWPPLLGLAIFVFLPITALNALVEYISYRRIFNPDQTLN
jgi:hypothetical protein